MTQVSTRRVVAEIERRPDELHPRVGIIMTDPSRRPNKSSPPTNQRGAAVQHLEEGNTAVKRTHRRRFSQVQKLRIVEKNGLLPLTYRRTIPMNQTVELFRPNGTYKFGVIQALGRIKPSVNVAQTERCAA